MGKRVPFVVDICSMSFEQLDLLLRQVSEGMDGSSDWPPSQEKECMVVATLNLLRLQVGKELPSCGYGKHRQEGNVHNTHPHVCFLMGLKMFV